MRFKPYIESLLREEMHTYVSVVRETKEIGVIRSSVLALVNKRVLGTWLNAHLARLKIIIAGQNRHIECLSLITRNATKHFIDLRRKYGCAPVR